MVNRNTIIPTIIIGLYGAFLIAPLPIKDELQYKINELPTVEKVNAASIPEHKAEEVTTKKSVVTPKVNNTNNTNTSYSSSHSDLMAQAGIPSSDWKYVDYIVKKESSWNHKATNRSSGAFGLCQALPASKMASAGADYRTNPVTQLKWCASYAKNRYGSWARAYTFWLKNHWW